VTDSPALSDVFIRFDLLGPTFVALEGLHYTEKSYLFKLSKQRFELLYGDTHGIAYLLDPRYIGDGMPMPFREDIESKIFTHHLDDKDPSPEKKTKIYQEYTSFRSCAMQQRSSNSFKYQMLAVQRSTIFTFWDCHKQDWPMLARLALKVFSLASSSAASERNFSSMAFIHSKLRNCLSPETVEKLVYIKTNNLQFRQILTSRHVTSRVMQETHRGRDGRLG
jgi:hypothetical protein